MKSKLKELDVDFIGEQGRTLTKEEEIAISNYIQMNKAKHSQKQIPLKRKGHTTRRKNVAA